MITSHDSIYMNTRIHGFFTKFTEMVLKKRKVFEFKNYKYTDINLPIIVQFNNKQLIENLPYTYLIYFVFKIS